MNVDFFQQIFRVSCTYSSDHSVYDGWCTYTHLLHAHFTVAQFVCAHPHTSSCVSHTRMAQVSVKRCLLHAHVVDLNLTLSILMFHPPSLLFLHGHFETTPDPVHTFLPYLSVLKAQDMRRSAHASRSLAIWPSQMQPQNG